MRRDVATLVLASAVYGFSIRCVHSTRFGLHNVIKFPLLFLITGAACAVAYFLFARLVGGGSFGFVDTQRLAKRLYRERALTRLPAPPRTLLLGRRAAARRARAGQLVPGPDADPARRGVAARVPDVPRPERRVHRGGRRV